MCPKWNSASWRLAVAGMAAEKLTLRRHLGLPLQKVVGEMLAERYFLISFAVVAS